MSDVVRVLQYRDTYLYRYTYIYTVTHPCEFKFVFIFEIQTQNSPPFSKFIVDSCSYLKKEFEFERSTLNNCCLSLWSLITTNP